MPESSSSSWAGASPVTLQQLLGVIPALNYLTGIGTPQFFNTPFGSSEEMRAYLSANAPQYYPGATVAPMNATQRSALDQMVLLAGGDPYGQAPTPGAGKLPDYASRDKPAVTGFQPGVYRPLATNAGAPGVPQLAGYPMPGQTSPVEWNSARGLAGGSPYQGAATQSLMDTLSGRYMGQAPQSAYRLAANPYQTADNTYRQEANPYGAMTNPYLRPDPYETRTNPLLDRMYQRAADQAARGVNEQFTRFGTRGSPAEQDYMARTLGGMATDFYGNAYTTEEARREAALNRGASLSEAALNRGAGLGEASLERQARQREAGLNRGAGLFEAALTREQARNEADLARQTNWLNAERGRQMEAAGLFPQYNQTMFENLGRWYGAGQTQQQQQQREIDAARAAWDYQQNLPFNAINQYMSVLSGSPQASFGQSASRPTGLEEASDFLSLLGNIGGPAGNIFG